MKPEPTSAMRPPTIGEAFRMRWKRRRLLWRSLRSRHQLTPIKDRTNQIAAGDILAVVVLRNEAERLPFFLAHYRRLGVAQFLVVDNGSTDGSSGMLAAQPDVSVWYTDQSYHSARFGLDWLTWLQFKYAHGHWCLTVDADEILVYADHQKCGLQSLTCWLDLQGRQAFGALMLDIYPKGQLSEREYAPGQDPSEILQWFDAGPYRSVRQVPLGNLWVQGGVRERVFFADTPHRSPTLNKIPLVKWNRRYAYNNASHSLLPPKLNRFYDGPGGDQPSGVLLHSKFLPGIVSRSAIEKRRKQHFHTPANFDRYYDAITDDLSLWHEGSIRLEGMAQLQALGLMQAGGWLSS